MPVERVGSSTGGQGKAVPVEETAVQLSLPIATAENPKGATRRKARDRLGAIRPVAIGRLLCNGCGLAAGVPDDRSGTAQVPGVVSS